MPSRNQGPRILMISLKITPFFYEMFSSLLAELRSKASFQDADKDSLVESNVVAPSNVNIAGETAVAMARDGDGKLVYDRDINAEQGSDAVVVAMCRLSH